MEIPYKPARIGVCLRMTTVFISFLMFAASACSGKSPSAGKDNASPFVDHSSVTDCQRCHEADRPQSQTHPAQGDCLPCHKYPSWDPVN